MALELTDSTFNDAAIGEGKVVLIDFWAQWCGPCRMMSPIIEELTKEYEGKAIIAKVDVDTNPEISSKYSIRSLPTFLVLKDGEVVEKHVGATTKNKLAEKIDAQL